MTISKYKDYPSISLLHVTIIAIQVSIFCGKIKSIMKEIRSLTLPALRYFCRPPIFFKVLKFNKLFER